MVDNLDKYIDKYSKEWRQVFLLLLMVSTPGIFNAIQISSYVFLIDKPSYWCDIPILREAGWSDLMILNVSTPPRNGFKKLENCSYYNRNYSIFAKNGYSWSLEHLNNSNINTTPCQTYHYSHTKSVVSEWNLVCDNVALKSNIQAAMAVGKFAGGLLFGSISDTYGRKFAFNLAAFIYMFSGPFAALIDSYVLFLIARFLIGVAGSGIYESSYTILTELTCGKIRTLFCLLMNMSYPIGYMLLSITAYYIRPWRTLLLVLSLPIFGLLIQCWVLPESPKWLMTQGRKSQAWATMTKLVPSAVYTGTENDDKQDVEIKKSKTNRRKCAEFMSNFLSLFSTWDLSGKTAISLSCGFACGLSYYVIALNGDNITADRYIYVALNGFIEGLAYVFTIPLLIYVGRKKVVSGLFFASGILQLTLIVIPQEKLNLLLFMTLLGKFCVSAVFSVSLLYISELYPTTIRNTGIGTSLTISQIGSIIAPYIVELLGARAWYIPSTVCGILGIFVSSLVLMLPETKGTVLPDTLGDMKNTSPVKVSNCYKWSSDSTFLRGNPDGFGSVDQKPKYQQGYSTNFRYTDIH